MPADRLLPKLNPLQISSLVVLMSEARELTNTDLKVIAGFTLTGTDRTKLNELKYVESRKVGQTFAHQLTDQGWRACRDLWRAERPQRAGTPAGALLALLAGLDRGLARKQLSLADFFGEPIVRAEPEETDGPVSAEELDSAIRAAYHSLAKEPAGWVGLADLRTALGRFDRAQTDEGLRRLAMAPDAHVIPVANLKSLTEAQRDAALSLGGEDNHVLSIDGR